MTPRLMLVDGSNILMRCALGGDVMPQRSTPMAMEMIRRVAGQVSATHLIVALDHPSPSWRKLEFPDYKANRTRDTSEWIAAGSASMKRSGWSVCVAPGFEADDVLATIALRAAAKIVVFSGDSDLLPLTADPRIEIVRAVSGSIEWWREAETCKRFAIPEARLLPDYKALCGDKGDNVPGVPGIGKTKAAALLTRHGCLERIIAAGQGGYSRPAEIVAEHADIARRALRLVTLRADAPVERVPPDQCSLRNAA